MWGVRYAGRMQYANAVWLIIFFYFISTNKFFEGTEKELSIRDILWVIVLSGMVGQVNPRIQDGGWPY